jgi:hypothetical protein
MNYTLFEIEVWKTEDKSQEILEWFEARRKGILDCIEI